MSFLLLFILRELTPNMLHGISYLSMQEVGSNTCQWAGVQTPAENTLSRLTLGLAKAPGSKMYSAASLKLTTHV
jgi:hypothetical protein